LEDEVYEYITGRESAVRSWTLGKCKAST